MRIVPAAEFQLAQPRLRANGHPQFLLLARPGVDCRIEISSNAVEWLPFRSVHTTQPVTEVEGAVPAPDAIRYYRARQ